MDKRDYRMIYDAYLRNYVKAASKGDYAALDMIKAKLEYYGQQCGRCFCGEK